MSNVLEARQRARLRLGLTGKLIAQFLLTALIPIAVVSILGYSMARAALLDSEFTRRTKERTLKTEELVQYLTDRLRDVQVLSQSTDARHPLELLSAFQVHGGGTATGPLDVTSGAYRAIYQQIDPYLRAFMNAYAFHDIALVCAAHGHVLYTAAQRQDLGTNLRTGPYRESGLARLVQQVLKTNKVALEDYSQYEPAGAPAAFVGAPVLDAGGAVVGVIAAELSAGEIDRTMQAGMIGRTSESFLVGEDRLARTNLRLSPEQAILKTRLETEAVTRALEGKTGTGVLKDYRGIPALVSYGPVGLRERLGASFEWVMISKMDEAEALASTRGLALATVVVAVFTAAIVAIAGLVAARRIARPIRSMAGNVSEVGAGDLTVEISGDGRGDEVGVLMRVFGGLVKSLRNQTRRIQEASAVLASSSTQISSTVSELAASITETTGSVNETTTTMEELKHTARLSLDKAQAVAADARQTSEISRTGAAATEESVRQMDRIRGQMGTIASAITRLSEQGQAIGEIIAAVNDLAGQSNLLAVNAAIEAARAGEEGKGFAVVAEEIRRMAEQSKQATAQVQGILQEIQRGVAAAVLAAEQGTKTVDTGMQQTRQTGDAIQKLGTSIDRATQAMDQITASSQEQMAGIAQVTEAMATIQQSSEQNAQGAGQLEEAARNLKDLGEKLQELVGQFKV